MLVVAHPSHAALLYLITSAVVKLGFSLIYSELTSRYTILRTIPFRGTNSHLRHASDCSYFRSFAKIIAGFAAAAACKKINKLSRD